MSTINLTQPSTNLQLTPGPYIKFYFHLCTFILSVLNWRLRGDRGNVSFGVTSFSACLASRDAFLDAPYQLIVVCILLRPFYQL